MDEYRKKEIEEEQKFLERYMNHNGDIIDSLIKQNALNLKDKIELLKAQIEERTKIKDKILKDLNREDMKLQGLINESKFYKYDSSMTSRRTSLEKQLLDIEREKLKEEVNAWKDTSKLNQALQYLIGKYEKEKGKNRLLSDYNNENGLYRG
ncbi:MAG: hypothetical protein ACFFG0_12360 [Candidatus Thorarchaeota archaeon]